MFRDFVSFVRSIYRTDQVIPLHEPVFIGNEKKYIENVIDSSFVSTTSGYYITEFENSICELAKSKYAVATVNGTSALHIALILSGVKPGDEVITQSLTFVATPNAISYCNAHSIFLDVSRRTLGLSAEALQSFLEEHSETRGDGFSWNKITNRRIKACVPMNTFGHPAELDEIKHICKSYNVYMIEDAAESLGSLYKSKHTGTIADMGVLSFNGNKIVTTGGGGMILTSDNDLAELARHLTTTAKVPHKWNFDHDRVGYNYRLPNINAALGLAQVEKLSFFIEKKRQTASLYQEWCNENSIEFIQEPDNCISNYWLNAILLYDEKEKQEFLEYTNNYQVNTRPVWTNMHKLKMYQDCYRVDLQNTEWLSERLVNLPSSVNIG